MNRSEKGSLSGSIYAGGAGFGNGFSMLGVCLSTLFMSSRCAFTSPFLGDIIVLTGPPMVVSPKFLLPVRL